MPKLTIPRTDEERDQFPRKCMETAVNEGPNSLLPAATIAELQALYTPFHTDYLEATAKLGQRMREVAESEQALARLQMYLRHTWTVANYAKSGSTCQPATLPITNCPPMACARCSPPAKIG